MALLCQRGEAAGLAVSCWVLPPSHPRGRWQSPTEPSIRGREGGRRKNGRRREKGETCRSPGGVGHGAGTLCSRRTRSARCTRRASRWSTPRGFSFPGTLTSWGCRERALTVKSLSKAGGRILLRAVPSCRELGSGDRPQIPTRAWWGPFHEAVLETVCPYHTAPPAPFDHPHERSGPEQEFRNAPTASQLLCELEAAQIHQCN